MLTIPKKELAACVVAAELAQFLHEELGIEKERIHLFSNSMICLFQLTKPLNVLTHSGSNRVEKIRNGGFTFQYVNTKENPADICSRGCDLLALNQDLWHFGPKWLTLPMEKWPKGEVDSISRTSTRLRDLGRLIFFHFSLMSLLLLFRLL